MQIYQLRHLLKQDYLSNMEILIYRNDETELEALYFNDVKDAISHMKLRAIEEGKELSEYIIKIKDVS